MLKNILFLFAFSALYCSIYSIDTNIPSHIAECYRNNMTEIHNKLKLPLTMQLLIDLIQKVEMTKSLDMRLLTTSMIYRAKFDGIQRASNIQDTEKIIPVGPTSIHFNKFRMLVTYLLSGEEELFPDEALSKSEFCALHRLISSSVQAWERGDESKTCPQIRMMPNDRRFPNRLIQSKRKSICPIEKGITKSNWGDISSGILVIAVAAALQNQDVKLMEILEAVQRDEEIDTLQSNIKNSSKESLEEDINNLWAATLAGDLGEVIAYQRLFAPKLILGQGGIWNDSRLPQAYYLPDSMGSYWEMTLAETLGGIDGAIIGNSIREWTRNVGRLRFSQVLDMYYSKRGVQFKENFKACQRNENIKKILQNVDLVKQTTGMAKLLQYYFLINPLQEWVPIQEEDIEGYCKEAVDEFLQNIDAVTDPHSACEKGYDIPAMDIFTVIDGTWTEYEGHRLISALVQATDISRFGSRMGIIRGDDGTWMTNFTHSTFQIFEDLAKDELTWPSTLSVSESLKTIIEFLNNKTSEECNNKYLSTRNAVILIISPTSTINSQDLRNTKSLIKTIKSINPSFSILYVTSSLSSGSFKELQINEYINDNLIETDHTVDAIVDGISDKLKDISGQIISFYCNKNTLTYEDYITPMLTTIYEIPYTILQKVKGEINVKFTGHEYGNLSICGSDKQYPEHKLCQWIDDRNGTVQFATKPFCQQEYACNVQFKVSLENSKNKCTDDECRFFNQARLQIETTWTSSSTILFPNVILFSVYIMLIFSFILL